MGYPETKKALVQAARALAVVVTDRDIRRWMAENDPKAALQAIRALAAAVAAAPADMDGPWSLAVMQVKPGPASDDGGQYLEAFSLLEPECEIGPSVAVDWKAGIMVGPWDELSEIREGLASAWSDKAALSGDDVATINGVP
jgi:hypothetical protein